jgi:hypothetical protein
MYKKRSFISKGVKLMAFGVGALVAGCGGGGGSGGGTATETAVSSYIADQQAGGFTGSWNFVGGASSVVDAGVNTLTVTATPNTYTSAYKDMLLTGGTWATNPSPWVIYDLNTAGWTEMPSTATLLDNGTGANITITPTGESPVGVTITKTSLAATPIVCTSPSTGAAVPCAAPGNYPAGAVSYQLSYSYASDFYSLIGSAGALPWFPITDVAGVALTALPAVGATFCDPNAYLVYKAIAPAPAAGADNYNVFRTVSCLAADITAALATPLAGTVLISDQATGNSVVANVMRVQSAAGTPFAWANNVIYGFMAGNVWYGWLFPAGGVNDSTQKNKAAINAELLASGLVALP